MDQGIRIDVVVVVSCGNIGKVVAKDGRDVGIFTVEVSDVRHKPALLKHVATTRQVRDPGLGDFRPSFISGKPLSVWTKADAWFLVQQGLMDRSMNYKLVQPHGHLFVSSWLQRFGCPYPSSRRR